VSEIHSLNILGTTRSELRRLHYFKFFTGLWSVEASEASDRAASTCPLSMA